jgi:hypothetical protein
MFVKQCVCGIMSRHKLVYKMNYQATDGKQYAPYSKEGLDKNNLLLRPYMLSIVTGSLLYTYFSYKNTEWIYY